MQPPHPGGAGLYHNAPRSAVPRPAAFLFEHAILLGGQLCCQPSACRPPSSASRIPSHLLSRHSYPPSPRAHSARQCTSASVSPSLLLCRTACTRTHKVSAPNPDHVALVQGGVCGAERGGHHPPVPEAGAEGPGGKDRKGLQGGVCWEGRGGVMVGIWKVGVSTFGRQVGGKVGELVATVCAPLQSPFLPSPSSSRLHHQCSLGFDQG